MASESSARLDAVYLEMSGDFLRNPVAPVPGTAETAKPGRREVVRAVEGALDGGGGGGGRIVEAATLCLLDRKLDAGEGPACFWAGIETILFDTCLVECALSGEETTRLVLLVDFDVY